MFLYLSKDEKITEYKEDVDFLNVFLSKIMIH